MHREKLIMPSAIPSAAVHTITFKLIIIIMIVAFFGVVLLFALALNAYYKIKEYKIDEKTVWEDGDSVCVKKATDNYNVGFMQRLA